MRKMHLLTLWLWLWSLTFQPQNTLFLKYPKVIPCIKFEHFGIICFLSYAADKQKNKEINKQTDPNILAL